VSSTLSTPAALVLALEANGPGAHLTRREWSLFQVLCRVIDPDTGDVTISHGDLADRVRVHRRTITRALWDLAEAGWISYRPGGRVGPRSTAVRWSYIRVHVELLHSMIEDGRDLVRARAAAAVTSTRARMRELLDARRRDRRRSVDNLAARLHADRPEGKPAGRPVIDRMSTPPPGLSPDPGGVGAQVVAMWGSKAMKARKADAATRRGPDEMRPSHER
jgi:Mn-dependent DtxR family transcriptional regulator